MWRCPLEGIGKRLSRQRPQDWRLPLVLGLVVGLAGCGEVRLTYGGYPCGGDLPAIVVEFTSRSSGQPVAVVASGTLIDGSYIERMTPISAYPAYPQGASFALAGGYSRQGVYDVQVRAGSGENLNWSGIRVSADRCGPLTVVLQARLAYP